jgi:hypothetical protein
MISSKITEDNVTLNLLVYFIGFSAIYNVWQGYKDFLFYVLDPETAIIYSIIMVLYYVGLITFYIYSIILLVKEKNNAILSTKLLLILLIIISVLQVLWIYYVKEGYEYILWTIIWIVFYFVFLIYAYTSKEIIKKFPKKKTRNKSVAILLFVFTLLLSIFLWVTMFGIQFLINRGLIPI